MGAWNKSHNESNKTIEYRSWSNMKTRCYNKNSDKYKWYGARGIKVCDHWVHSYENFLADMGRAPSTQHSIERIDNNGNYEPSNCRWATRIEQANNKRSSVFINYRGENRTIPQWCKYLKLPLHTIFTRIRVYKWTPEESFNRPIHRKTIQ